MALLKLNESAEVRFLKPSKDHPHHPWVVLCYDPTATTDEWVVWLADDAGNTIIGGYHSTFNAAKADFDSR